MHFFKEVFCVYQEHQLLEHQQAHYTVCLREKWAHYTVCLREKWEEEVHEDQKL